MDWQPSAKSETLRKRAAIIANIRIFFAQRDVLEVETPALSAGTVTDVHLDALQTQHFVPQYNKSIPLYLQTSPEYAMKRLLAAGYPDLFQICKCFRVDEIGALHNPEFTMLEWYRKNFAMQDLIDEVSLLLMQVLNVQHVEQRRYQDIFQQYLQFDPLSISLKQLLAVSDEHGLAAYCEQLQAQGCHGTALFDAILQVLFSQKIEPLIGRHAPMCITHFPASQAALARLEEDDNTARRFEFYFRGTELANGFEELLDADIQLRRFEQDNKQRELLGKPPRPIDLRFISSLRTGLPACSGVALGLDRLIMLALNCQRISEVMSFDITRA